MAFPNKGDRVAQPNYGAGTILEMDTYHTVIDFDAHGLRRFATNRVVLAPTNDPGPSAEAKKTAEQARAREERKRKKAAGLEKRAV